MLEIWAFFENLNDIVKYDWNTVPRINCRQNVFPIFGFLTLSASIEMVHSTKKD